MVLNFILKYIGFLAAFCTTFAFFPQAVKVWKTYAIEIGIKETDWDKGVNKAVDKHYGSKYNEKLTNQCHKFLEATIPNGEERVKKVAQTLY